MITPAVSPNKLDTILHALLDPDQSYADIARTVGVPLNRLMLILDTPEVQEQIQRMQRLLDQRARLLVSSNEAAASGALTALIEEVRTSKASRDELTGALCEAKLGAKTAEAEYAEIGLKHLDDRFKKLTEAARCARALLAQSRSRLRKDRVRPRDEQEPESRASGTPAAHDASDPARGGQTPGGMPTRSVAMQGTAASPQPSPTPG
jgi:hypothetical protein